MVTLYTNNTLTRMCTKHVKHSFSTMSDIYWLKMVTVCKCQETHHKAIQTRMESWCLRCNVSIWTSLWKQAEAFPFWFSHFSNSDTRSYFIFSIFKLSEPRVFSLVNFLSFFFSFSFFFLLKTASHFIHKTQKKKIAKLVKAVIKAIWRHITFWIVECGTF